MEPKSPSKSKPQITGFTCDPRSPKFVVVTISIILIFGMVCGYFIFKERIWTTEKIRTYFTVVLDCGSTGSRVNVFEWMTGNDSRVYGNLPVLLRSYPDNVNKSSGCQYHCMQTEPGLHYFVNDVVGVRASLEPLIRYAEQWVPLERRAATPIFILATAGMRRLVAEEAKRILGDVETVVKEHEFLYRKSWVRVLTGKEEAYYGWAALNYKMGVFGKSSRTSTLGLLDLGGSSLQVVAEVDVSTKDEHVFRSKIGPVEHDIVAYSLPAFGLNEAFDRTIALLSHTQALGESAGGVFEVRHPCLGSGFVQNYTCHGCFGSDYSRVKINMSNQVQVSELNSVFLVGEPNWEQCKVIAGAAAINSSSSELSYHLNHSKCIGLFSYGGSTKLNLTKTLHTVSRYHALSGFFAVYHALNLSQRANLSMLWESGEKLCSGSWADQESSNGQYCFRVPYLTSLIENALCLSDIEIIFGPGDVSWTLGASLIEGEFLWLDPEKSQNPMLTLKDYIMIPSPVLIFVLLLSLLLIVYCCQIKLPMPGRKTASTRTSLPSYLCPKRQIN
ncbi:probable apyrase 7 [Sesamum indicum]|uniref:Probable apyrase 7 n=1 Tax=Sesamum indicum TaxID=4182 RepID=A0A6I9SP77_SESIN|nr:probable apyrase 7 [Sesamum indicum]XP_011071933.1 probable apyrase 7 [Sesamum indicum]